MDKSTEAILPHDSAHRRRHRYAAFAAGDLKSLRGLLAPDITWHAPGRNPLAALEEVLTEFIDHYKHARPHQGIGQRRPCEPAEVRPLPTGRVERRNRLAGVLHEYSRAA